MLGTGSMPGGAGHWPPGRMSKGASQKVKNETNVREISGTWVSSS